MLKRMGVRSGFKPFGRSSQIRKLPSFATLVISIVISSWLAIFILNLVFPFESWNPFEQKLTVGQKVIEDWKYGGLNPAGELLFYQNFNEVAIPANKDRFDAAGDYVLIRDHTADTLTIESREDFIVRLTFTALLVVAAAAMVLVTVWIWLTKTTRPARRWTRAAKPANGFRVSFPSARQNLRGRSGRSWRRSSSGFHSIIWKWRLWQWRSKFRR